MAIEAVLLGPLRWLEGGQAVLSEGQRVSKSQQY